MKKLLLIDASALIYRFFYALPPLTTPDHEQIQAIYGLANIILKIANDQDKPDFWAAALDRPERTLREEQFKDYKSHRPPVPDPLINQLQKMPELFRLFKIRTFDLAGYEADDLLGTLAKNFSAIPDLQIVILSGDLDVLQLVRDDKVVAQIIKSGLANTIIYNEAKVMERYELPPNRLPDYKGLIGDASDNIPGVKGVGPKTAVELLKEFGTLENIYENLPIISGAAAKKMAGTKETALMCRSLAEIKKDAPIAIPPLADLKVVPPNTEELKKLFNQLGFVSLIKRLEEK